MPVLDQQNLTYKQLQMKYSEMAFPRALVELGGKQFENKAGDMFINDIHVELSAGFEASVASFRIYNVFDSEEGCFRFEEIKKQVVIGKSVTIKLGYHQTLETVFVGFVAAVSFCYDEGEIPYIEVNAMDLKGIMMGGKYAYQCTAKDYGSAVREILQRTAYEKLKSSGGFTDISVDDTSDKKPSADKNKESDYTIEFVSESDYEFIVKAAKKFNYEFFIDRGKVYFRKAKSNNSTLMTLKSGAGLVSFRVEYSLTGLVAEIEARAMDAGQGKIIKSKQKYPDAGESISTASTAKGLLGGGSKVVIDPTIRTQSDADARAASLKEEMSYRLGVLEGICIGMPDLVPGRFIKLDGLGSPADNKFYLTEVVHDLNDISGFRTKITGKANKIEKSL